MELERLLESALQSCHLDRSRTVLVGVSGGPDSLCLLDGLARLQFPVVAAHFDHRLRPGSGRDADVVRSAAASLGVPFISGSADVAQYARDGHLSLEEAGRELRYQFLFEQARRLAAQAVAVGHTADDQVETVLLHLLRGAGLNGLQGMHFRSRLPQWDADIAEGNASGAASGIPSGAPSGIALVRPLLAFWRSDTLAYCQERGLQPVFDPSNQDMVFFRNRIRHEIIPLLESCQPQVRQNIWRMAQVLAGEDAVIQAAAEDAWASCLDEQRAGFVALRQEEFLALPEGLQRRVLRQAIGDLRDIDFETVERAIRFARSKRGGNVDLVRGLRLFVAGGRLVVTKGSLPLDAGWPQLEQAELHLTVPGEVTLPQGWRLVSRQVVEQDVPDFSGEETSGWEAWFDADALPGALRLRCARPGDRFQPLGMAAGTLKLSDFWINVKLPRRARAAWPLLTADDRIAWVPGFRLAHPYRVQKNTRRALHLRLFRVGEDETLV